MFTRRRFLSTGAAAVPLAAAPLIAAAQPLVAAAQHYVSLDADQNWRPVHVPHTWQIEPGNTGYRGIAWYTRSSACRKSGKNAAFASNSQQSFTPPRFA
jgi:hypothetical protein